MRYENRKDWHESVLISRLGVVRNQIEELENERGALIREQNRRSAEALRVKSRLTSG